jgi:hypothetical protein
MSGIKKKESYVSVVGGEPFYYNDEPNNIVLATKDKNNKYNVIKPLDKDAETKLLRWFKTLEKSKILDYDNSQNKELDKAILALNKLVKTGFEIIDNQIETYKIYSELESKTLALIPLFKNYSKPPAKSTLALKEWYNTIWDVEKNKYLGYSIDKGEQEIIIHEITFAENQIVRANRELEGYKTKASKRATYLEKIVSEKIYNTDNFSLEINNLQLFIGWLKGHIAELNQSLTASNTPNGLEKIKWLGKTSQIAYLFSELAKKGFIDLPTTRGDGSYSKLGVLIMQYFDVDTTIDNMKKEVNPAKNSLSETSRNKFVIPDIKDLQ